MPRTLCGYGLVSSGTPRDAIRIIAGFSAPVDVNQAARIANAM
jgi:hypothetical protein